MHKISFHLLAVLLLLTADCLKVQAQTDMPADDWSANPPAAHVDLPTLIEEGLRNNFQLRIVRNQERIAENNATRANAGYLPKVNLNAGYNGSLQSSKSTSRQEGIVQKEHNSLDHNVNAGVFAEWTVFDGFKIQTNYKRLQELRRLSATQTRLALEDYVADVTAGYYDLIQQNIRLTNLQHAMGLSKERLRIVEERYFIGSGSKLAVHQARVDFNADSARWLKQHELLRSAEIRLNRLTGQQEVNQPLMLHQQTIGVDSALAMNELWQSTLQSNAQLLKAAQNRTLAELDLKGVKSRDFPYLKLNADYAYRFSQFGDGPTDRRSTWGPDFGITVGYRIFDGNRNRERHNAQIGVTDAELAQEDLKLALKADLADLWQAYQNNLRLLNLERENLITAQENHQVARERYLLGDLSGIEMRDAQQNLLEAEERILVAEYHTKLCEISLHQLSGDIMQLVP